ncbi:hypothetical protein ACVWY6_001201 [Williamsia sp. R60]
MPGSVLPGYPCAPDCLAPDFSLPRVSRMRTGSSDEAPLPYPTFMLAAGVDRRTPPERADNDGKD